MSPVGTLFGFILSLGAGLGSYYVSIFVIEEGMDLKNFTPCEQLMTPNNSVAFFTQPDLISTLDWLDKVRFMEEEVADNAEYIYRKFHTVIVNCPLIYQNYSSVINAGLRALVSFNSQLERKGQEPMKFWLRLQNNRLLENEDYISDCTELAMMGNKMYPGLVAGVIVSQEMLWDVIQSSKSATHSLKNKKRYIQLASSRYFKGTRATNSDELKYGLMVDPTNCHIFATKIPDNIFQEFSNVFYFHPEPLNITSRGHDGLTVTAPNYYGDCKNDFNSKDVTFTYTFPTDMVSLFGKIELYSGSDTTYLCVNHGGKVGVGLTQTDRLYFEFKYVKRQIKSFFKRIF